MGREIRKVPAHWEHPVYSADLVVRGQEWKIGTYIPLYDDHPKALEEFADDIKKMGLKEAIDYHGGGPQSEYYVDYGDEPRTWIQLYQTVSEGAPLSPPFATPEELIDYLCTKGDFWEQKRAKEEGRPVNPWRRKTAETFLKEGWCPSGIVKNGVFYEGPDSLLE